jgi:DNA-nicking Smr family endonuclease
MSRRLPDLPDHDLWAEVTRGVRPLHPNPLKPRPSHLQARPAPKPAVSPAPPPPARAIPPPLAAFDRRTEQKLQRGKLEIDARIDLHGSGLEVARVRLHDFIVRQRFSGARLVLVITGKGASPFTGHTLHGREHYHAPEREGKLRRHVPGWLAEPEFRYHVVGFQPAHPRHGGGGALYVRLRRNRAGER